MKRLLVLGLVLLVQACTPVMPYDNRPDLEVVTDKGIARIRLTSTQPVLTDALIQQVQSGRYNQTNIVRLAPRYLAVVGDAAADDLPGAVLPYAQEPRKTLTRSGEVGVLVQQGGAHGTQFVLMLGQPQKYYMPPNATLVGRIIEGQSALNELKKGDQLNVRVAPFTPTVTPPSRRR